MGNNNGIEGVKLSEQNSSTMKKTIKKLMLALTLGASTLANAQETWYFGTGGIKFSGAIVTSSPPPAAFSAVETSSVLVDPSNNVIMYSDGINVYNGNGALQFGGLWGHSSSTQGTQIVPIPSSNLAFIFTLKPAEICYGSMAAQSGLNVSLVSITGTAPSTTISLITANYKLTPNGHLMSEKLSVVEDGRGGYWVVTHGVSVFNSNPSNPTHSFINTNGGDKFYAYNVRCNTTTLAALDATEAISAITNAAITPHNSWSHMHGGTFSYSAADAQLNGQGQMKMFKTSNTTARIATTLAWFGNASWSFNPVGQLFDFDLTNGMVSNATAQQFSLNFNNTTTTAKDGAASGVEFSQSGRYLYVSGTYPSGAAGTVTPRIYRYDLISGTPSTAQLVVALAPASASRFGLIQRGPDGRIYIARSGQTSIDVLNSPDAATAGAVGYATGIAMGGTCSAGLPNTVLIDHNMHTVFLLAPTNICAGQPLTPFGLCAGQPASAHFWELYGSDAAGYPIDAAGNPVSNTSLAFYNYQTWVNFSPAGSFTFPGSTSLACGKYYTIKLAVTDGCGSWTQQIKTVKVTCIPTPTITSSLPNPVLWGSTVTLCTNYTPSSTSPVIVNDWANNFVNYPSPADNLQCINVTPNQNTTYTVTVTEDGCTGSTSYYLHMGQSHAMSDMPLTSEEVTTAEVAQTIDKETSPFLSVKPNPSNGVFSAVSNEGDFDELRVYDSFGRLVFSSITPQAGTLEIDLSKFEKGLYFVTAISDGKQETQKVIVQ
jgi:hypothetical protein